MAAAWKPGRTTGPDGVSYEALRTLLEHEDWAWWLSRLFTGALETGSVPGEWTSSATVLLPKKPQPSVWQQTRPITLSAVVLKTLAQHLQLRAGGALRGPSSIQFSVSGRQSAEMTVAIMKMLRCAE